MSRHRAFVIWALVLLGSGAIELILGPVDEFFARLSPIAIWQLPRRAWAAIVATILASSVAWFSAVGVGGVLGFLTAVGHLGERETGRYWQLWSSAAGVVRRAFNWLYVVPLVLTISVVTTLLLNWELENRISQGTAGVLLVVASGVALAGQRVFVAIDDAVAVAASEDAELARSLYLGARQGHESTFAQITRVLREVSFLVHCRINLLAQALEQAFHLAVVGVVILETVSGLRIYEKFFPQEGHVLSWGGGIGRVIIDGQNATNPALVAGAVWLILMIDSVIAWGIRIGVFRFWVVPYRSRT
jgi:hypothetical protein